MDPEQWKKHHENFVQSMVQILANRPTSNIMVFIDNGERTLVIHSERVN